MPKKVDVTDLVGAAEIAERFGASSGRTMVKDWKRRYSEFPAPVAELSMGAVWAWADVEAWGRATGRLDEQGSPIRRTPPPEGP